MVIYKNKNGTKTVISGISTDVRKTSDVSDTKFFVRRVSVLDFLIRGRLR